MDVILWVIQLILAGTFITTGLVKLVVPLVKLRKAIEWVDDHSIVTIRTMGAAETLGGFGLFFSGLFPITPLIIPVAAYALSTLMVFAIVKNVKRGDRSELTLNIFLFVLACFVAVGRTMM